MLPPPPSVLEDCLPAGWKWNSNYLAMLSFKKEKKVCLFWLQKNTDSPHVETKGVPPLSLIKVALFGNAT